MRIEQRVAANWTRRGLLQSVALAAAGVGMRRPLGAIA